MDFNSFYRDYTKKKKFPLPADHSQRVEASLAVQIHTTGARPAFNAGKTYGLQKPKGYDAKFDVLFATRLLNRHPNESIESYNWRLSVYAPVAKELYDRFLTMCRGTILQPNSFDISVDENTDEYIKGGYLYDVLHRAIPFILENPYGYMAVIESDVREKDPTEPVKPTIVFIPAEKLIMMDDTSCAFYWRGLVVFMDNTQQVVIQNKILYRSAHKFEKPPIWDINNNFMEPFVSWADMLVRNMNDDEQMTKQYSYPIRQAVRPACTAGESADGRWSACVNGLVTDLQDPAFRTFPCKSCGGTGIKSMNPGDDYTISEESIQKNGGKMIDMVRYTTPDIGIPKYHLDRWQVFYDRTEKALCLNKKINATESGDAKREDRKDQYFYLMTISNFLFEHVKKALEFVSAYLNYDQERQSYKETEIVVVPPKQFDLMTDSDLVLEFAEMQKVSDDSQLLAELQYQVNRRLYRTDKVQLIINEVLYNKDPLYGIAGNALRSKLLSGVYDDTDKIIHEKGYSILKGFAREMSPKVFEEIDLKVLMDKFMDAIAKVKKPDIYNEPQ